MSETFNIQSEKTSVVTAAVSLAASIIAGAACIGPLLGIALGVTGLGWLAQYSYLTLPASILSVVLFIAAIYTYKRRKTSCINRRKHVMNRYFLVFTAVVVTGINVFEYVVLPSLA